MTEKTSYDFHTLHVDTGSATKEQIEEAFLKARDEASSVLGRKIDTLYTINVVSGKGGIQGYTYIWVKNREMYNILVGNNPDGSRRVREVPNPNYDLFGEVGNWADEEDEFIEEQEPPIATMGTYTMTAEQKALWKKVKLTVLKYDAEKEGRIYDESKLIVPEVGTFVVQPAWVHPPKDPDVEPNILFTLEIPSNITELDLFTHFSRFSSSSNFRQVKTPKGFERKPFPIVNIFEGIKREGGREKKVKRARITFDPSTADAQFAMKFSRPVIFNSGGSSYFVLATKAKAKTSSGPKVLSEGF